MASGGLQDRKTYWEYGGVFLRNILELKHSIFTSNSLSGKDAVAVPVAFVKINRRGDAPL